MARFLVDEDLARSVTRALATAGYDVCDVRDVGLRGHADEHVFAFAVAQRRVLLTADLGFANLLAFPLGSHAGILVARFPNELAAHELANALVTTLALLSDEELEGSLVIVEPHRLRLRRSAR